ncbi:MAG: DUF4143 domain-containing protein [Propionibacteriaceae bacterium]|jgi:hypothetical protein|nr:DUF4143 domain-containing protein [Propionibacteriaceae bacterium]
MCLRDLAVYADSISATLNHYRDDSGLDVDAVLAKPSGAWAGIEIKWNAEAEDAAATSLLRPRDKMAAGGQKEPAFLAIMVGLGEFANVGTDGGVVIPCDTLGA